MCFYFRQTKQALEVANRFKIKKYETTVQPKVTEYNGFTHPLCETVTYKNPDKITYLSWGLIPSSATSPEISGKTLNARIETAYKLKSFKDHINERCLIISDGFYEWQHYQDKSGKVLRRKYLITMYEETLFSFAGICSWWRDPIKDSLIGSFSILTTQANDLMAEIHNTKQRMPVILRKEDEESWIQGGNYEQFAHPYSVELKATIQEEPNVKRGDSINLLF